MSRFLTFKQARLHRRRGWCYYRN